MRRAKNGLGGVFQESHSVLLGQRSCIVFLPLSPSGNGVKPRPFSVRRNAKRNRQGGRHATGFRQNACSICTKFVILCHNLKFSKEETNDTQSVERQARHHLRRFEL